MLNYIQGCFAPGVPNQIAEEMPLSVDTIVAIALSALSLGFASGIEKDLPELATLLRILPVGIALIWLFRRLIWNQPAPNNHYVPPLVYVIY